MSEDCFPYSKFEFMQEVDHQQRKKIEERIGESFIKCILHVEQV